MKAKSAPMTLFLALFLPFAAGAATLDECIRAALDANPDAQAAAEQVRSAQAAIREARSAYYPQLAASSMYSRSDNPPQVFFMQMNQQAASMQNDFNHPDDWDNLRASLGAKMRLLDGGQRSLAKQMAELGTDAAKAGEEAIRNELIYQITRGYYGVLQAQAFVKVQDETVQSLEENLRVANERVKAGSAVQTDVLNLEVKLAQAREDLIRAQNAQQLAVAALNTAIGQDLVRESLPEGERKELAPPAAPRDNRGIDRRPELQAARLNTKIQEKAWSKSKRDYFPTISAFGSSDWDSDVSSDFHQSYFAGAVAEWDLFTGFRRGAGTEGAQARLEAARAQEQKAANNLRLDLTQAQLQVKESWERLDVARRSVQSAEEALRITRERYQQGAADITELLTAQVGLTATRTRNVAAHYDYLTAQSNLERAQGLLLAEYEK